MSDQSALAPATVITGPVWDMWPTVKHVVKQVQAGVFAAQDYGGFSYMGKGGSYLAPYHDWDSKLPPEVKEMVSARTEEILAGTYRVDVNEGVPESD
jgi:basic membrane lipoprotein Med (substrate-binding protein (PBP1-ABC) superfamily)